MTDRQTDRPTVLANRMEWMEKSVFISLPLLSLYNVYIVAAGVYLSIYCHTISDSLLSFFFSDFHLIMCIHCMCVPLHEMSTVHEH